MAEGRKVISVFYVQLIFYMSTASVALVNCMEFCVVIHNLVRNLKIASVKINHSKNNSIHVLLKIPGQIQFFFLPVFRSFFEGINQNFWHLRL